MLGLSQDVMLPGLNEMTRQGCTVGATTLSITTFSIMTLSITTFSIIVNKM